MRKSIGLLAVLFFFCNVVFAQNPNNGTVKGFVYDAKTGEPLISATLQIVNGKTGVQTDVNGFFSITLPSGSYTLMTTLVGYDSNTVTINLLPGSVLSKKILLSQKNIQLQEVAVSGRKTEKMTHINTGVTNITPRELKLLPSAGGEPDLAQYLQVIPGVVFTGDQGGQLYIRGGSPSQTGIYLDGVTIFNPFHSIGLFSVFETEAIRNVDVYSAGFNAQYGNRTSAIVDVHTKDGNKNEATGIVSISPIMARFMIDGPLVKSKKDNGAGITYLLAAKTSYLDQTSKTLYSGLGEPFSSGLPYKFTDLYGKVTLSGDNGSKINFFAFNFDDKAQLLNDTSGLPIADYHWQATGAGTNFVLTPASSSALIDGKLAFSNYNVTLSQNNSSSDSTPRNSTISGFEAAINFTYFLPDYSQLKYGVEVSGYQTSLNYYLSQGVTTTEQQQSTMAAMYLLFRHNFSSRFIFEPSIRFQYYSELNKLSPEPRLGIKYNLTENIRLKAAAGVYSQNVISTKNDQDIVNLFTGFLLSNQQIANVHGGIASSDLQTAYHGVGGVEFDVKRFEFNVEPWVKYFGQINEINHFVQSTTDPAFIAATGLADGVDFSAKYSKDRIFFWCALGYQNVNYTALDATGHEQTYPAPFDTRFNANVVSSYDAGKKKEWEFSARFNIHAPFPFTQTQGFYESQSNLSLSSPNPTVQNGSLGLLYANQINGGRLSWYHRLDISVKRRMKVSKKSSVDATFAITNVYDRANVFYVDRYTNVIVDQLPIFPSLNITWNF
jgi:CarboxypepD_reg-like domain/TonB-dependent Receptor Plug Domain